MKTASFLELYYHWLYNKLGIEQYSWDSLLPVTGKCMKMLNVMYIYNKILLQFINSRLLNSKMGIYAGISSCAGEILVFPVWYVLFWSTVTKFLGQTEVNNVELPLYKQ